MSTPVNLQIKDLHFRRPDTSNEVQITAHAQDHAATPYFSFTCDREQLLRLLQGRDLVDRSYYGSSPTQGTLPGKLVQA